MKQECLTPIMATVTPALRARGRNDVLPCVHKLDGTTFVVRCSGQLLSDPELRAGLGHDVALLHFLGLRLVLVHGGTEPGGLIRRQRELVGLLGGQGCHAVGLTATERGDGLGYGFMRRLIVRGAIPVVMPRVDGLADTVTSEGADALAGVLSQCLAAEKLLMLSDSPGMLDRGGRLIESLCAGDAAALRDDPSCPEVTRARLQVALEVLEHGVGSVRIIDGRRNHALLLAVLSNSGEGTLVFPGQAQRFRDDSLRYLSQ